MRLSVMGDAYEQVSQYTGKETPTRIITLEKLFSLNTKVGGVNVSS